jgi:hypothetical protein
MKRSNVTVQSDLFSSVPAPPVVTGLQHHHDELVELLSKLLQEVVQGPLAPTVEEKDHEQDQR